MLKRFIYIFFIGAGLTACSSFSPVTWKSDTQPVDEKYSEVKELEMEIAPFRDSLSKSMNEIIGSSNEFLVKGRPCSELNNWAADALLQDQDSLAHDLFPNMALLNVGGLRSTINAGDITVGDMFTFMPFDNLIVWVKLPKSVLSEVAAYLNVSGGEPISNAELNRKSLILSNDTSNRDFFWVVTSDYLMNGGDNMSFFNQKIEVIYTEKLLRDAFIDQVRKQGKLVVDKNCRIHVE